jgi:hypothetical protein
MDPDPRTLRKGSRIWENYSDPDPQHCFELYKLLDTNLELGPGCTIFPLNHEKGFF